MTTIISRSAAKAAGLNRYFTGEPCIRNHVAERNVSGASCIVCAAEWVQANRERLAQQNREWAAANPERRRASKKKYWDTHPEKVRAGCIRWEKENPEKVALKRQRYKEKNWPAILARIKIWQKLNPHIVLAAINRRRAAKLRATPAWADHAKIAEIYRQAKEQGKHVDHFYPLQGKLVCGLHVPENLQLLDPLPNRRKSNKMPDLTEVMD